MKLIPSVLIITINIIIIKRLKFVEENRQRKLSACVDLGSSSQSQAYLATRRVSLQKREEEMKRVTHFLRIVTTVFVVLGLPLTARDIFLQLADVSC